MIVENLQWRLVGMLVPTDCIVSITEANQNFSKVARLVDERSQVVVMKNNKPKYLVIDLEQYEKEQAARKEFDRLADKILVERIQLFRKLAE
jgi:antitoxin Phd